MASHSEILVSNWLSGVIKVGVLAILLADVSHSAHAGYADCRNSNYYTTAIQLMRALYPELQDKDVTVQVGALQPFEADGPPAVFNIWISEVRPTEPVKTSPNLSSAERVGHLSVHFEFDPRDNRIDHIFSSGSFLNGEKQEALAKLVDEHPDWDEAKITDALLAAGAKFGPNQTVSLGPTSHQATGTTNRTDRSPIRAVPISPKQRTSTVREPWVEHPLSSD